MASQDDWKISRQSGRENRSTTSSFGMHLLKATKPTFTGHRPPSNYSGGKPFATLTSGWRRLRSTGSPATLNITFSTRLWHRRIGGGGGDLSVFQNRREAAYRFRSNYPFAHYGHYREKKTILRATSCKAKSATELRPDGACGVEADYLRHRLTPHRNSKKSAAHSPYENQRSIAAMTAARRRVFRDNS